MIWMADINSLTDKEIKLGLLERTQIATLTGKAEMALALWLALWLLEQLAQPASSGRKEISI